MASTKVPLLDRLPAQVRHLVLIFLGAFIAPLALKIQDGVNPLTWNLSRYYSPCRRSYPLCNTINKAIWSW
jgi:hypothetical protein